MLLAEYKTRTFPYLFVFLFVAIILFIAGPDALDSDSENQIQAILIVSMFAAFGISVAVMLYKSGQTLKIYSDRFTISDSSDIEIFFRDIAAINLGQQVKAKEFKGSIPVSFSGEERTTTLFIHTKNNEVIDVNVDHYLESDQILKLLRKQLLANNP